MSNMYNNWMKTQVAIYHRPKANYGSSMPNCFGNLITETKVLTAASCFVNMKKLLSIIEENKYMISAVDLGRVLERNFVDPQNFPNMVIAKVNFTISEKTKHYFKF